MMRNKHLPIILITINLLLSACSSAPKKEVASETPVYKETVMYKSLRNKIASDTCMLKGGEWKAYSAKRLLSVTNTCVSEGKWSEVEELGNHLARIEHVAPWGSYYLSLAAEARKDYSRALWMAELAAKKAPKNALIVYQQGRIYWSLADYDKSIELFKAAIKLDSSLVDAQFILGKVFLRDQNYADAQRHLQAVITLEPNLAEAHFGLSECLLQQGDSKAALESIQKAISLSPKNLVWRLREAKILEEKEKDYEAALESYKKIQSMSAGHQFDTQVPADLRDRIARLEGLSKPKVAQETVTNKRNPSSEKKGVTK